MELDSKKIFKTLNLNKIWIPIILGLGIVFYLFVSDPDLTPSSLGLIYQTKLHYILLIILAIFVRDLGYIYRIRTLTNKNLNWLSSFYVIVLWEFSSAVTPSVVGGTAIAVFLLLKEGIKLGKSLAYVMLTAIFDNLFFVIAAPIALFSIDGTIFPTSTALDTKMTKSLQLIFWLSYFLITLYTLIMSFALFVRPRLFKWLLLNFTRIRFLRKWKNVAQQHGNDILLASKALRGQRLAYWLKISWTTFFIWSARYIILNLFIAAYVSLDFQAHAIIFGKHIIMWITMLISPTPGSSGTAEFFFKQLYTDLLNEYTLITGVMWRGFTYYLYLILGAIFLPKWIKKVFFHKKANQQQ